MKKYWVSLATARGAGYLPHAPGTWGTGVGLLLFLLIRLFISKHSFLYIALVIFFIIFSIYVASKAEKFLNKKDAPEIVIDEIAGFLVTCIALPAGFLWLLAAFILFRLGDILKPFPARWVQNNCKGGLGIVGDDVIAGIYACLALQLFHYIYT
ncbi:MAG: phosphatidylglycerophosphatase A [Deltaproteobacteria bacterium]|nr:phosphatidylglycerophosphatase A [Deltaproteobacteria bacterium]